MDAWTAERPLTEADAARLVASRFPALGDRAIRLVDDGWDNTVFLVDEALLFRFPRRQLAVEGGKREMAALPLLAPRLPLPIPVPTHLGNPGPDFPWPFFGYRRLPGRELAECGWSRERRDALAVPLAGFLRALHAPGTARSLEGLLPSDPFRRGDPVTRARAALERLEEARGLGLLGDLTPWARVVEAAASVPRPEGRVVCHGDLHFRHLLVEGSSPSAVIDWGDLCLGDPALDLSLAYSQLSPAARQVFLSAYGPVPVASLSCARLVAIFLGAALLVYGAKTGRLAVRDEALASLRRAIE